MDFTEGNFYHIYNRGNNKQPIFFKDRNFQYFIDKMKRYIAPNANLLAWCLMPNHFHFLVQANSNSISVVRDKPVVIRALSEGIRLLLSSYSQGIHQQEGSVGNLFQQRTRSKLVDDYLPIVFQYIHQNPLKAGLVDKMENYKWSSFQEYCNSPGAIELCNKEIIYQYVDASGLLMYPYDSITEEEIKLIEN